MSGKLFNGALVIIVPANVQPVTVKIKDIQVWDKSNRPSSPEWLLFTGIIDPGVELTPITTVCHEQFGKIAGCQCDIVKSLFLQLADDDFQDRHFADGHERLW